MKELRHLQAYSQKLALQGANQETARLHETMQGAAAAAAAVSPPAEPAAKRLRTQAGMQADAPTQLIAGSGLGGSGGTRKWAPCSEIMQAIVPLKGHACFEYLITAGMLDANHDHARDVKLQWANKHPQQPLPSLHECQSILLARVQKADKDAAKKDCATARKTAAS